MQIKSRTFDMGMSGTMMVCEWSPNLEKYYEPFKEFIPIESLEDCAEKFKYLSHEEERFKVTNASYLRTKNEHTWEY